MTICIRSAKPEDAAAVAAIYNPYITDTCITFEEATVSAAVMAERIEQVLGQGLPYLLACHIDHDGEQVLGYCYATPWRARSAYRFSVEVTVYLAPAAKRQGIGTLLYQQLLTMLAQAGYHLVIAGITLPNDASIALHEKMGMQKVAQFDEVGFKFNEWRSVGYWQLKLAM